MKGQFIKKGRRNFLNLSLEGKLSERARGVVRSQGGADG